MDARKELVEIEMELREMVHHRWCSKDPRGCPRDHFWCKWGLNYGTAVAWQAAQAISVARSYCVYVSAKAIASDYAYATEVLCREKNDLVCLYGIAALQCKPLNEPPNSEPSKLRDLISRAIDIIKGVLAPTP